MGINVNRIISITFAGFGAWGRSGGNGGHYFRTVTPMMGLMPGLKGFVAAVLGGLGIPELC